MKLKKAFNFYNGLFYNILYCLYNMMKLDKKMECLLVLCHAICVCWSRSLCFMSLNIRICPGINNVKEYMKFTSCL